MEGFGRILVELKNLGKIDAFVHSGFILPFRNTQCFFTAREFVRFL